MTHRSESLGFIDLPSDMADSGKPVSTGRYRFLADNGLHMGDQFGRVLVNWQDDTGISRVVAALGEHTRLMSFGPVRLTVDPDGVAYPIRVLLAGGRDGKVGGTVSFTIMIRPIGSQGSQVPNDSERSATSTATGLATPVLLPLTSYVLKLNARETARCLSEDQSSDDGSVAVNVPVYKAYIDIFGKKVTAPSDPVIYSVYAAEYVGL